MSKTYREFMEERLDLKSVSIEALFHHHLTTEHTHALGAIRRANIRTVDQLLDKPIDNIPGSGEKSDEQILQALMLCYIKQGIKYIKTNAHQGPQKLESII